MPPGLSENELPDSLSDHLHTHASRLTLGRDLTYRKLSALGTSPPMDRKSTALIGIVLSDEKSTKSSLEYNKTFALDQLVLGTICVENLDLKVDALRSQLCTELSFLPNNFCFLTKEGWPIRKAQETSLKTSHIINEQNIIFIRKQFEKQKIGIVGGDNDPLGFIFIDFNNDLKQIREAAEQQIKISQNFKSDYRFIEKNGWPVVSSQESMLTLLDILIGSNIHVQSCNKLQETSSCSFTSPTRPTSVAFNPNVITNDIRTLTGQDSTDTDAVRRKKSLKFLRMDGQNSEKVHKDSQKRTKSGKEELDLSKPILISYVRAEGAQYALDLKQFLVAEGFSVYLDVHEIKTGTDWQDALNFAVTHCFLFVPLITPMYGKTQWTNREIKLADVLGKIVVPVNFMDLWPPPCLAIQFASTQYIPWKLVENEHSKCDRPIDSRTWPETQLKRVTHQIAECYKYNCEKLLKRQPSTKEKFFPRSRPLLSFKDDSVFQSSTPSQDYAIDKKQNIVISAHPGQHNFAQNLKLLFERDGHSVWCSSSWQDGPEYIGSDVVDATPRDLSTIAEDSPYQHQILENTYSIENKKSTSIYFKEPDTYGHRPLSRLMSQFSDISQPSALSQEKLDRLHIFQEKVDQAGVVIVLVSEDYIKSTFSQQQVFYCEHRKRVVLVKCDAMIIPKWFKLLMGNNGTIMKTDPQIECVLKAQVKRALNPSSSETPKDATFEAKINYLVNFLKCNNALQDIRVYITGSSKLQTTRAEDICKAIGQELAKVNNLSLVTGGFFGASDVTAKAFCDANDSSTQSYIDDGAIVHILPIQEKEDLSSKARQNPDGSFEVMPYGKTYFIGDTLKERETVVARMVDVCIVIEGGIGVVHEVEEFIWNDHFVIPIRSTGGAAGGKFGIPVKIFELPPGVDSADWSLLSNPEASPASIASAVVNIIFSLRKAVSPTNTIKTPRFGMAHKHRKKSRKNKASASTPTLAGQNTYSSEFKSTESINCNNKYVEEVENTDFNNTLTFKRQHWWQRFLRIFK